MGQRCRLASYLTYLAAMLNSLALLALLKGSKKWTALLEGGPELQWKEHPRRPTTVGRGTLNASEQKVSRVICIPAKLRWFWGSMAPSPALQPGWISGYLELVVLGLQLSSQLLARNGQGAWKRMDIA